MAAKDKRFYYIKLDENFYSQDEIKLIKRMPNGLEYIIFYQQLLLKSAKSVGYLRLSDLIPYDEAMLAVLTDTNVDVVKGACKCFIGLGLMTVYDDGTIYMNEIEKYVGSESYWAERKRIQRAEKKNLPAPDESVGHCPTASNECPHILDIDIDKDKEIDIDKESAAPAEPARTTSDDVESSISESVSDSNTGAKSETESKLDTRSDKKSKKSAQCHKQRVPYQEIVDLYHGICVSLPTLRNPIPESRKKAIKARYKDYGIDGLKELFEAAEESDFLSGRSGDWQASFDWLMKPSNAAKVLEGNYKNKRKGGNGNEGRTGRSADDYYSTDFRQA